MLLNEKGRWAERQMKCLYRTRIPGCLCAVSLCALCQWPQYSLLRLALGLGADGNGQIPGCDLGQDLLGRKQCRERQDKPWHLWAGFTCSAELVCGVVLLPRASSTNVLLSPFTTQQPLRAIREAQVWGRCSPGKIPVAAGPEFLLLSASRAVPEVSACRQGVTSLRARTISHQNGPDRMLMGA